MGHKVPLSEVEKLEDYQQNIKPNLESNVSSEDVSSQEISSITQTPSSSVTTGAIENDDDNTNTDNSEPSFYKTPTGIVMIVLCSLLSIAILALGVWLIVKNKKR
mgnify:CR=1 FL=1